MKKLICLIVVIFLLSLSFTPGIVADEPTFDRTIYVDDDNTGGPWDGSQEHPYQFIQDGVDNASDGDTVFVYSGLYRERINIKKSINLFGENKEKTIIDGDEKCDGNHPAVIYIKRNNVRVCNFSLENSGIARYGIKISSHYIEISNCVISNNYQSIWMWPSNNSYIHKNHIVNNTFGMMVYHSGSTVIEDNVISGDNMEGISVHNSNDIKIQGNQIINNRGNGVSLSESHSNQIIDNRIENNWYGIVTGDSEYDIVQGNLILLNTVGIILSPSLNCTICQNIIKNNTHGGIWLHSNTTGNTIYHNNLINNSFNALTFDIINNTWDNGKEGNYWDDYSGVDANSDGIGDLPYNIPGGDNQDRYPLMEPYTRIEVEIKGGFGLKIIIKNVGDTVFTNLTVQISIDGPIILGGQSFGEIMFLEPFNPGVEATFRVFIFGFGRVTITVSIELEKWKVEGLFLGPFVFILDNYRGDGERI